MRYIHRYLYFGLKRSSGKGEDERSVSMRISDITEQALCHYARNCDLSWDSMSLALSEVFFFGFACGRTQDWAPSLRLRRNHRHEGLASFVWLSSLPSLHGWYHLVSRVWCQMSRRFSPSPPGFGPTCTRGPAGKHAHTCLATKHRNCELCVDFKTSRPWKLRQHY